MLAEKLDVKVLLLPPGDDPDSFAQSHSSSEVEAYLNENERDIIAFMTEVLMRDVPANDPTARAKVVNVILQSVSHVDDPVKRQEYISQCSRMLGIPEEVLVRQLNIFITGRFEEEEKNAARRQAQASIDGIEKEEEKAPDAPLLNLDSNRLRPYEEMLARYLVRYGLLYIVDLEGEDGSKIPATVYDVIANELGVDGLSFSHPPYAAVFEAVKAMKDGSWQADRELRRAQIEAEAAAKLEEARDRIRRVGGSMAQLEKAEIEVGLQLDNFRREAINEYDVQYCQTRLINSPDDMVRNTAVELVVDRYTLSKIYSRQGEVQTEQDQLPILVPRAIYELRNAIVSDLISDLTKRLAALIPENADEAIDLLRQISEYKEFQRRLSEVLGDRIILPGRRT